MKVSCFSRRNIVYCMDLWRQLGVCLTKRSRNAGEEVVWKLKCLRRGARIGFSFRPHPSRDSWSQQNLQRSCQFSYYFWAVRTLVLNACVVYFISRRKYYFVICSVFSHKFNSYIYICFLISYHRLSSLSESNFLTTSKFDSNFIILSHLKLQVHNI
jgi:hypothetical protein